MSTDKPTIDFKTGIYAYESSPWRYRSWDVDLVVRDVTVLTLRWDLYKRSDAEQFAVPLAAALNLPLFVAKRDNRRRLPFTWTQLAATPPPRVAGTAPGSPASAAGSQPGATNEGGAG